MSMFRCLIASFFALIYITGGIDAQSLCLHNRDTSTSVVRISTQVKTRWIQRVPTGVPLLLTGALLYKKGNDFQLLRNEYTPGFSCKVDNFLQYVPSLMVFGLKAGGMDSKNDWKSLGLNYILSGAVMIAVTKGLNLSIKAERPGTPGENGFPSGHTALAFMGAHIVAKEYGREQPWMNFCAYTIAGATGLMRILNNKHYIQDVIFGAGTGILSAEAGYYLSDLFRKNNKLGIDADRLNLSYPNFQVSIFTGVNQNFSRIQSTPYVSYNVKPGVTAGSEILCNFSCRFGAALTGTLNSALTEIKRERFSIPGPNLSWQTIVVSPQYSIPLYGRGFLCFRAGAGYSRISMREVYDYALGPESGLSFSSGLNYIHYMSKNTLFRFYTNLEDVICFKPQLNLFYISSGASVSFSFGPL
jgi:hypothetical protein